MKHTMSGEAKRSSGTTWLIYGPSGSGKTPLASCFPHPWIWDFEGGVQSLLRDDILVSSPESYSDVLTLLQLAQRFPAIKLSDGKEYQYCTIVIDTAGEMARVFERSARGGKEQATLAEWYLTVERCRNVLRHTRNLARDKGINVVVIAHEQYIKSELEVYQGLPDMPGKELPIDTPKLYDIVGHMRWRQTANGLVRELVCEPHHIFVGRDRRGVLTTLEVDLRDPKRLEKLLVEKGGVRHVCDGAGGVSDHHDVPPPSEVAGKGVKA
jgi:hypothetical protein